MKKAQDIFISIVNKVENNSTPLRRYIFLFFAILSLRLALEFFSSHRLFTFFDIIHIGLWFVFIVSAFLVQLHLFSAEQILKTIKLVITFFTIALTAPIIDLLVSQGGGAKMNYLSINSIHDVVWSYFTIGGSSLTRGATIGIRIEIVLLVLACFNYVYTKRKSVSKAFLAAIGIYTVLFLSGTIPYLLSNLIRRLKLQYQSDDQSTLLLLLILDLILIFYIVFKVSPIRIREIFRSVPILGSLLGVLSFIIGAQLALENYVGNWNLNPTTLFWFPLFVFLCICFMGYTGLHQLKKKATGFIQTNNYWENGLLLIMLVIGALISSRTFFAITLIWGLLFMLNEAPLYLERIPVLRNVLYGMVYTAISILGFSTFGGPMVGFPHASLFAILFIGSLLSFFTERVNRIVKMRCHQ